MRSSVTFKIYVKHLDLPSIEKTFNLPAALKEIEASIILDPIKAYKDSHRSIINGNNEIYIEFPTLCKIHNFTNEKNLLSNETFFTTEQLKEITKLVEKIDDVFLLDKQLKIMHYGMQYVRNENEIIAKSEPREYVIEFRYNENDKYINLYSHLRGEELNFESYFYYNKADKSTDTRCYINANPAMRLIQAHYPELPSEILKGIANEK